MLTRAPRQSSSALAGGDTSAGDTLLLRGGELAINLRREIRAAAARLFDCGGAVPRLVTVCVAETPAAMAYRRSIIKTLERACLLHQPLDLPESGGNIVLRDTLLRLSSDTEVTGVLVLMPLPAH